LTRESVTLSPSDQNMLTTAVNGILANLTVIENLGRGRTGEYVEVGKPVIDSDLETKKKPPVRCSVCGKVVSPKSPLAGSINPPFALPGFRNDSKFEGKYHYTHCSLLCAEKLGNAVSMRQSDVEK